MKKYAQIINTILIVVGGGILMYSISGVEKDRYLQILGLIIIMFGLYRASNYWAATKDDHEIEEEEISQTNELNESNPDNHEKHSK